MEHPLKEELLPSRVREMVSSIVPKQKKLMVATGVVPMPSEDFVLALYQLCYDDDKEISSKSLETLKNTPKSLIIAAAKKFPWSEPLDFLARAFHKGTLAPFPSMRSMLKAQVEQTPRCFGQGFPFCRHPHRLHSHSRTQEDKKAMSEAL